MIAAAWETVRFVLPSGAGMLTLGKRLTEWELEAHHAVTDQARNMDVVARLALREMVYGLSEIDSFFVTTSTKPRDTGLDLLGYFFLCSKPSNFPVPGSRLREAQVSLQQGSLLTKQTAEAELQQPPTKTALEDLLEGTFNDPAGALLRIVIFDRYGFASCYFPLPARAPSLTVS